MKTLNTFQTRQIAGGIISVWFENDEMCIQLSNRTDVFVWHGGLGFGNFALEGDGKTLAHQSTYRNLTDCGVRVDNGYESYYLTKKDTPEGYLFKVKAINA